jgi:phosphate transport system permease protein
VTRRTQRLLAKLSDRASTVVITGGGLLMIGSLVLIFILTVSEALPLFGPARLVPLSAPTGAPAAEEGAAALASNASRLTLAGGSLLLSGDEAGRVSVFEAADGPEPKLLEKVLLVPDDPVPVTVLGALVGGETVIAGDARGRVRALMRLRDAPESDERRFRVVRSFEGHGAAVTAFAGSPRGRTFVTGDAKGTLIARYATTARTLASAEAGAPVESLAIGPKGNTVAAATPAGTRFFALDAPHPEISFGALFGKELYEGYDRPEFVWQSSGSTDDFEAKLSLVPLVFGTLKGTFYALLFAVPIALSAALYTSAFAPPGVRAFVKPVVEVMAALPSVVLGFLAGLWLAPAIQSATFPVLLLFPAVPLVVVAGVFLRELLPWGWRRRVAGVAELGVLVALAALAAALCFAAGPALERLLFAGDFKSWLYSALHLRYDARNSVVIAFAMGFAVIPIIFTISEDALSSVPPHLKAASLALGASPWQTAVRVVLPTASAGIFSALMVGFGRAVGETMIVLMATGNTPIMEWSPFDGMRTLSANIAVEISEAPQGGTLYRVLFLSALLLFVLTFLVNTLAEAMRQRLRKKYSVI